MNTSRAILLLVCLVALEHCLAHRRKKTAFKKSNFLHRSTPSDVQNDKASKKQDMVFNDEMVGDKIGEGPVGKAATDDVGMEGLGGEAHGVPTGMGAGAEPLGAFENDQQSQGQQSLDDKSENSQAEQHPFINDQEGPDTRGKYYEEDMPTQNSPIQHSRGESTAPENPMKAEGAPNPSAVSMSNNLNDIDGVNVQGDGEIGKYIRHNQKGDLSTTSGKEGFDGNSPTEDMIGLESHDPPFTGGNSEQGFNVDEGKGTEESDSSKEEANSSKRHLVKQKSKRKKNTWKKPFKALQ